MKVEQLEEEEGGVVAVVVEDPGRFPDFQYRKPKLNKFDLQTFVENNPVNITVTGIGKRKSGKTEFLKWMLIRGYREEVPWGWTFTHTKHNRQFLLFMPSRYIIPEFSKQKLEQIKVRQVKALDLYLKNPSFNPRTFVIWDDYNGYDIIYNEALKDYYMTGRHYHTMNYFFIQYKNQLPPPVRDNTDYLVLWNSENLINIEQYWMEFAGKMSKDSFFSMFSNCTESVPHGFLFIDTDVTKHYDEKFFFGVADMVKCDINTIVGCEQYWRYDQKQLNMIANGSLQREFEKLNELSNYKYDKKNNKIPNQIVELSRKITDGRQDS